MRRRLFLFFVLICTFCVVNAKSVQTVLSVQINGVRQEMVYFDCVQSPFLNAEFHFNPSEDYIYKFTTDEPVCMLVNGRNEILLQSGDSLHVVMNYEGRTLQDMIFSGTDRAVYNNQLLWNVLSLRKSMRFKSQLLGCVALDIKPKTRIEDARHLYDSVIQIINTSKATQEAKDYVLAETEESVYNSFMEYPVMYEDVRKVRVKDQEIGDYWTIMDNVKLNITPVKLSCPQFISLLMRYCFYQNNKKAQQKGLPYKMPARLEEMYKDLSSFYDGDTRDAVLYSLLCNFIRNGKELQRVDPLYKDYKQKYNKKKGYLKILDRLLQ